MENTTKELELIKLVQKVRAKQKQFFAERKKGLRCDQTLEEARKFESQIDKYLIEREKQILDNQIKIF